MPKEKRKRDDTNTISPPTKKPKQESCQELGCKTIPCFNYAGQSNGIYCAKHKLLGMVDVKHKKCQEPGCKTSSIRFFNSCFKTMYEYGAPNYG